MATITQRVTINRPVEEVWDFLSTFENTTRWPRGILKARQTPRRPLRVGSTLQTGQGLGVDAAPPATWSLSTSPTTLLLIAVVQATKAYARRHLPPTRIRQWRLLVDGTVHTAAATTIIRFERHLNHRIGTVWAALTEPDQLQQWLATPAEIELRVGGRVHLVPGQLTVDSTVTALDPPHLLEYGWHDRAGEDVTVRWELTPQGGGTRVVFTETFPTSQADQVSGGPVELAAWHLVLDRLEAALNGQQPKLSTDGFEAHLDRYTRALGRPAAGPAPAEGGRSARQARQLRPSRGRRVGDAIMSLFVRAGLVPSTYLLTTRGRKTGRPLTHPATVVDQDGRRWLVAPYGAVSWVHNARAAGRVTLARRGHRRHYAAREVPAGEAGPVLKRYVGVAAATRPYFGADKDAPVEDFVAEADRHPVFELLPINQDRPDGG